MATDLKTRPSPSDGDERDPAQQHYDKLFNDLTSPEHQAKEGVPGDKGTSKTSGLDEETGGSQADNRERQSLYNATADKAPNEHTGGRFSGLRKSVRKHKWVWAFGGLGIGTIGGVFLLFLLLASFMVPHLYENIAAYQFGRVLQQATDTNERVLSQKVAIDAADNSIYTKIKAKYDLVGTKVGQQWSRLDKFRPNKVIQNMDQSGELRFNYQPSGLLGRERLVGITMGNTTVLVENTSWAQRNIPLYRLKGQAELASKFQTALQESFRANEIGPITRGKVASAIRSDLKISLTAWNAAKYKNMDPDKARLTFERDAHNKISTPDSGTAKTDALKNAVEAAREAEEQAVSDDDQLRETVTKDNGTIKAVTESIENSTKGSWFQSTLGVLNGAYAIATPVCIVYDGSISHSGSTVDAQREAQTKAYYLVASGADQQKDGTEGNEVATGALNAKLGDISTSNAMLRASGQTYDTSGTPSADASAGGSYTLFDVIFGGGTVASGAEKVADEVCPYLTSPKWAIGGGAALLIINGISGGSGSIVQALATKSVTTIAKHVIEKFTIRNAVNMSAKVKTILGDSLKSGAKVAAATVLAKMVVASKAGYLNNGLEQGADFANLADSGGNVHANEIMRQQFYGRPLTKEETAEATQTTLALVTESNKSKSLYERYASLSNPNSLLTTVTTRAASSIHKMSWGGTFASIGQKLTSPSSLIGSSFAVLSGHAHAAIDPNELNYNNVQFGWTEKERAAYRLGTYSWLENQRILDASGQEAAIENAFSKCFNTSLGDLLQNGDIQRDDEGNVLPNEGDCAPNKLTIGNPDYCYAGSCDLVFRWRLSKSDDTGLATLEDQEEITESESDVLDNGADLSFRIATYNVKTPEQTDAPNDGWLDSSIRVPMAARIIKDNKFDIVGLQEIENSSFTRLKDNLGDEYSSFPKAPGASGALTSLKPIFWKGDSFQLVDSGTFGNSWRKCEGVSLCTDSPWVKLRDTRKDDGREFYVVNIHMINENHLVGGSDTGGAEKREATAKEMVRLIRTFDKDVPVFVTGDFNSSWKLADDDFALRGHGDRARLPYCILTQDSLVVNVYDTVNSPNKSSACPTVDAPYQIDHIYTSPGVRVNKEAFIRNDDTHRASDHDPLYADILVGGTDDTVGGWTWPIVKGDYTGIGQCWNNPYATYSGAGRHAGLDIRASTGTKVYAAHNGVVSSYEYNQYGGHTLIIDAENGLWYNYQHLDSSMVQKGDRVQAGELVAISDNSGSNTSGAHLHFGIAVADTTGSYADNSQTRDPLKYLPKDRDTSACN